MRSLCPFFTHTARAQKLLPAPRSPHEACSVDAHRTWARRPLLLLFLFLEAYERRQLQLTVGVSLMPLPLLLFYLLRRS
jgi:hypothetical protein